MKVSDRYETERKQCKISVPPHQARSLSHTVSRLLAVAGAPDAN
jgi:hypothetical protein